MTLRSRPAWLVSALLVACGPSTSQPPPALTPSGTFALDSTVEVGTYPMSLASGDFTGDGTPDLAVGTAAGVSVLPVVNGAFAAAFELPGVDSASDLEATDLDGDGLQDLLRPSNGVVEFWRQTRPRQFVKVAVLTARAPEGGSWGTTSVTVADATGDGLVDLVLSGYRETGIDGTFVAWVEVLERLATPAPVFQSYGRQPLTEWPGDPVVADLTGDGRPDVAVAEFRANRVSVLDGRPGGLKPPRLVSVNAIPDALRAGDLDGDGRTDLIATSRYERASLLRQAPDGGFEAVRSLPLEACGDLVVADLDADGLDDVAALCTSGLTVLRHRNGQLVADRPYAVTGFRLLHADVTGDGVPDLVISTLEEKGQVHVLRAETVAR